MKLRTIRTLSYSTYTTKEVKELLKKQIETTVTQILRELELAEFNSSTGTRIMSYENTIIELRKYLDQIKDR